MLIWKQELPVAPTCSVELPRDAKILCVQVQYNVPTIWYSFEGDPNETEPRTFVTVTTGNTSPNLDPVFKYLGTFQMFQGTFVGHVFYC